MTNTTRRRIGRRNIRTLYVYTAISRLWFDGGLWVIYFQHRGLSVMQVGILEALLHVTCLLTDVPIGVFADRFGWKRSLAFGTLCGIGYTVIALIGTSFWWMAVAFIARGLQVTFTSGSDASIAYESADWAGETDRYRTISGRMLAITLLSLGLAEAIGGSLAHFNWSSIYVAFTAANVLAFVTVLFIKEPRAKRLSDAQGAVNPSLLTIAVDATRFAKRNRMFIRWLALSATMSGFIATFAFYGQALLLHAGWTLVTIGVLTGIENGIGAIAATRSDRVARRIGDRGTIIGATTVAMVGLVLFAWLPGLWAGLGFILNSIAGNVAEPVIDQSLNRIVPSTERATLLSANSTAFSLFMVFLFPLFGVLAQHTSLSVAARTGSVVGVVCIVIACGWWRQR